MSKLFILCNIIKLLKQSLHAQKAVRLRLLCPFFEVLCVIHRESAGGGGVGREQQKGGGFRMKADDNIKSASDWLVLGSSFCYWPTS
jgi:hypothetical protein